MQPYLAHPFDHDKLHEECGVFGVIGVSDAANFVALGLHALQHRGQEAGGIVTYDPQHGFNSARRFGYVRDTFTKPDAEANAFAITDSDSKPDSKADAFSVAEP